MATTATQDDDLIIFNDEAEDEIQDTSGASGGTQNDDTSTDDSDELITFEAEDKKATKGKNETDELIINEDSSIDLETAATPEALKTELIDVQDNPELTSFDDMGIDLEKLGDKEGENLKGINTTDDLVEAKKETTIEASKDTDFGFDLDESENKEILDDKKMNDDIGSIEDFASGFADSDIDESTLIWILEATILKVTKREEVIWEQIAAKEEEIWEIRGEIEHLKINYRVKEGEIAELNIEREKITKTREGIEKMKEAS